MAWLLAYEWERMKFSESYQTSILPEYRIPLTRAIAKHYGLDVRVMLSTRGRGLATTWGIDLPKPGYDCALGLIIHEVAHHLSRDYRAHRVGHSQKWKTAVIKIQVESKYFLPAMLKKIADELTAARAKYQKQAIRQIKVAERKVEVKAYRKTRGYRIEQTVKRIANLERKVKGLTSRLKSAKRSLAALQRAEIKASKVQAEQTSDVA